MNSILNWIGTWDWGNVADWVSGVGSLLAVVMIFIQIRKDKESEFNQSRPFFKINFKRHKIDEKLITAYFDNISDNNHLFKNTGFEYEMLEIKNYSTKNMSAVQVIVEANKIQDEALANRQDYKTFIFKMNSIRAGESVQLLLKSLYEPGNSSDTNYKNKKILYYYQVCNVKVYFTTDMREKIKYIFYCHDEALVFKKQIFNNKIDEKEYSIINFEESYKIENQ